MTTFTSNAGFVVDPTGSNVGTWADNVTNPDFIAIDGMICGVQTISVTNVPVTLTSPATFTPTPGAGPTQSQNRVLRFTGVLTGNVVVTLPIPGVYVVENLTSSSGGAFVLSFRGVTATQVVGTPQGEIVELYNDGANVQFVGMARLASLDLWAGFTAIPAWVTACTVKPYLLCDGTVYNISDFPQLGARLGSSFGGNGLTTFGVPDLRGRVPLAYDGTGTRITVAGCGINGQTVGASIDSQTVTLMTANLPAYTPSGSVSVTSTISTIVQSPGTSDNFTSIAGSSVRTPQTIGAVTSTGNLTGSAQGGTNTPVNNVQPSIVTGIWVVKT